jgi:hypothetical protein
MGLPKFTNMTQAQAEKHFGDIAKTTVKLKLPVRLADILALAGAYGFWVKPCTKAEWVEAMAKAQDTP